MKHIVISVWVDKRITVDCTCRNIPPNFLIDREKLIKLKIEIANCKIEIELNW